MPVARELRQRVHDLHQLIDGLQPEQARRLLRLVKSDPEFAAHTAASRTADEAQEQGEADGRRRLASTGIIDSGRTDLSERVEEFVSERFTHSV